MSIRYKENVKHIQEESSALYCLEPVTFYGKGKTALEYGLIAEDVFKVMPSLVLCNKEGEPLSVKYDALTILLLNEIKKLNHRIADLEQRFDNQDHYD